LFPVAVLDILPLAVLDMPLREVLPDMPPVCPAEPPKPVSVLPVLVPPREDVPLSVPRVVNDREADPPRALPEPPLRLPPRVL
jgi:hypothetical protein